MPIIVIVWSGIVVFAVSDCLATVGCQPGATSKCKKETIFAHFDKRLLPVLTAVLVRSFETLQQSLTNPGRGACMENGHFDNFCLRVCVCSTLQS